MESVRPSCPTANQNDVALSVTAEMLTGRATAHLVGVPDGRGGELRGHADAARVLAELARRAEARGFAWRVASGHRTFAAQAKIWNE